MILLTICKGRRRWSGRNSVLAESTVTEVDDWIWIEVIAVWRPISGCIFAEGLCILAFSHGCKPVNRWQTWLLVSLRVIEYWRIKLWSPQKVSLHSQGSGKLVRHKLSWNSVQDGTDLLNPLTSQQMPCRPSDSFRVCCILRIEHAG